MLGESGGGYLHGRQCARGRSDLRHNGLEAFSHDEDMYVVFVMKSSESSLRCAGDAEQKDAECGDGSFNKLWGCRGDVLGRGSRSVQVTRRQFGNWLAANLASFCRLNILSPSRTSVERLFCGLYLGLQSRCMVTGWSSLARSV